MLAGLLDRLGCGRTLRDCCTSGSRSGLGEGRRRASYLQSRTGRLRKWLAWQRVQAHGPAGRQPAPQQYGRPGESYGPCGPTASLVEAAARLLSQRLALVQQLMKGGQRQDAEQ